MALRRWLLVVIALTGFVVVALAAAWIVLGPRSTEAFVHRSAPGGFELSVPGGWRAGDGDEHDEESPYVWFEATRPTRFGPSTAWLWVSRGVGLGDDPLATARDHAVDDIRQEWGDVEVAIADITVDGGAGLRLRYRHPVPGVLGLLPGGEMEEVRYLTTRGKHVYELGIAAWRDLPSEANRIAGDLDLFAPTGARGIRRDGFAIDLPGAWNEHPTEDYDMPRAVWVATTPDDGLPDQWSILWHFDEPYADAIRSGVAEVEERGKLVDRRTARFAGHRATRLDFTRPRTDGPGEAHYVSWIVDGPDGRAWQLLVGSLTPDLQSPLAMATTFRFVDA